MRNAYNCAEQLPLSLNFDNNLTTIKREVGIIFLTSLFFRGDPYSMWYIVLAIFPVSIAPSIFGAWYHSPLKTLYFAL